MPSPSSKSKYVVEYQLTDHEIVNQWFRSRVFRPKTIGVYGGLIFLGIALVLVNPKLLLGWAILAFPFVFALVFRSALQRTVKKNPAMTAPRSLIFDSTGVVFASGTRRNEFEWKEIGRFTESKEFYYLHLGDQGTVADIPKSAFTPDEREAFLSFVQTIPGKKR